MEARSEDSLEIPAENPGGRIRLDTQFVEGSPLRVIDGAQPAARKKRRVGTENQRGETNAPAEASRP